MTSTATTTTTSTASTAPARRRTGSRAALPANADKVCASCGLARGNRRTGWQPITRTGEVVGWTCPDCPSYAEPIRREATPTGRTRFQASVSRTDRQTGRRAQLRHRFDTLAAAREWVAEIQAGAKRAGQLGDPAAMTLRQLADRWLAKRTEEVGVPGGVRQVTINGYASSIHGLLLVIGDRPIRAVTPGELETVLRRLAVDGGQWRRGLSHRSLAYALGTIRLVLGYAVREGWLKSNPATEARAPRAQHRAKAEARLRWSPAELVCFRTHVDAAYADATRRSAEPWAAAAMRLTLSGLRRSEVLGLDWSHVDRATGSVEIVAGRVKTGRGTATALGSVKSANSWRTVKAEAIHPGTAAALRELWLAQGQPETGLVITDAVGQPVAPDAYSARFRALCQAAGLQPLKSIHNVRHTIATSLQAASVPDHQAAALLGHDTATYRRFYLIADDDGAAEAALEAGRIFA